MEEFESLLARAGQYATFPALPGRAPVSLVLAALRASGHWSSPGAAEQDLGYPFGGNLELPSRVSLFVVRISIQKASEERWLLSIAPALPIRATAIPRRAPGPQDLQLLAEDCYRIARAIHDALAATFEELRWGSSKELAHWDALEPIAPK
jgi:hypothetical protein